VELPKLSLDKFTDSYFKAAEDKQKKKKGEDEFFKTGATSNNTSYCYRSCVIGISGTCAMPLLGGLVFCGSAWVPYGLQVEEAAVLTAQEWL
jgi:hypothetical protein